MKNTKKHESGRSMIEMVGVLAIAGLLTAGAFVLIQNGMSSQRRARAADEVSALLASARSLSAESDDFNNIGDHKYLTDVTKPLSGGGVTLCGAPSTYARQLLKMSTNVTPFGGDTRYAILGADNYLVIGIMCMEKDDCEMMARRSFSGSVAATCVAAGACGEVPAENCKAGQYNFNVLFTK